VRAETDPTTGFGWYALSIYKYLLAHLIFFQQLYLSFWNQFEKTTPEWPKEGEQKASESENLNASSTSPTPQPIARPDF